MVDVVRYSIGRFHIATFRLGPTISLSYKDAKMFRAPSKKNADGSILSPVRMYRGRADMGRPAPRSSPRRRREVESVNINDGLSGFCDGLGDP
jgi:hypothetical protein